MPEKSRQRRVQIAKRQGKATAIKSSDVGRAGGLSRHAAKKSRHVEGLRTVAGRTVSRKMPPGQSKTRAKTPSGIHEAGHALMPDANRATARVSGAERRRPEQRVISLRSPSALAAKERRRPRR